MQVPTSADSPAVWIVLAGDMYSDDAEGVVDSVWATEAGAQARVVSLTKLHDDQRERRRHNVDPPTYFTIHREEVQS